MDNSNSFIESVYSFRNDNIIIGLTGRTGSGCSTVADLLKTESFEDLPQMEKTAGDDYASLEENLKQEIVCNYMKHGDHWRRFDIIEVSAVILSFVLEGGKERLFNYIEHLSQTAGNNKEIKIGQLDSVKNFFSNQSDFFEDIQKFSLNDKNELETDEDCLHFYLNKLLDFKRSMKATFDKLYCNETIRKTSGTQTTKLNLYTFLMQKFGNNLRATGQYDSEKVGNVFSNVIVERIDKIIKLIGARNKGKRVCIDALRNPLEILYFKDRYKFFYTFSINVEEDSRCNRLKKYLTDEELKNLDKVEYPQKHEKEEDFFFHQDIQKCIEFADIHINNPDTQSAPRFSLVSQLIKYLALIIHPGLITPSKDERCMQIAYNAKLNSGCLSRQVGAVITTEDYSIKAVGWNDVPSRQMPCNLRTIDKFCLFKDSNYFSEYELTNKDFEKALKQIRKAKQEKEIALPYCYCFKDIYNAIEKNKNQVHTRSLHAEENAFLQLSKDGGIGINGGKLFVTASPCELCSKKSYQLGIKDVFYIDPYPGIAQKHILGFGKEENRPRIHLFKGVVGEKFVELYLQRISPKDELSFLCGFSNKTIINEMYNPKEKSPKFSEIEYKSVNIEFKFNSRTEVICETSYELIPRIDGIKELEFILSWTGSEFGKIDCAQYEIEMLQTGNETLHKYKINFKSPLTKDKLYSYKLTTRVQDSDMVMLPHIIHRIKHITRKVTVSLCFRDSANFVDKGTIRAKCYADFGMEQLLSEESIIETNDNGFCKYTMMQKKPILNYCYGIDWNFIKE